MLAELSQYLLRARIDLTARASIETGPTRIELAPTSALTDARGHNEKDRAGHVAGVERTLKRGRPDEDLISTSYVERFNLLQPDADAPVHTLKQRLLEKVTESLCSGRVMESISRLRRTITRRTTCWHCRSVRQDSFVGRSGTIGFERPTQRLLRRIQLAILVGIGLFCLPRSFSRIPIKRQKTDVRVRLDAVAGSMLELNPYDLIAETAQSVFRSRGFLRRRSLFDSEVWLESIWSASASSDDSS